MTTQEQVKDILQEVLQLDSITHWDTETELLGAIPEFDSMAVVSFLTSVEDQLGIFIEDDEIDAQAFMTIGTLASFIAEKTA